MPFAAQYATFYTITGIPKLHNQPHAADKALLFNALSLHTKSEIFAQRFLFCKITPYESVKVKQYVSKTSETEEL